MSSARRTQEDLRRIIGLPDTQGGLQPPESRLRIDTGRGIFVIGTGETQSGAGNGAVDDEGDPIDPVEPPEGDANQNDDGSGTGDSSTDPSLPPEIEVIDPEDSNYDVGDDLYGGDWGSGGAISFVDCVEDTCIEIVPRGGYIPPDGWTEAPQEYFAGDPYPHEEEDPSQNIFVDGVHWVTWHDNVKRGSTPSSACRSAINSPLYNVRAIGTSPTSRACQIKLKPQEEGQITYWQNSLSVNKRSNAPDDEGSWYVLPPPTPWPADNCIQLAKNDDGQWEASANESPDDMTVKYSTPKSTLDLCTPSGDGVQILPAADGGSVLWNYSQGSFMAISPDGKRSFGSSSALRGVVAGAVYGGGAGPKAVGDPVPN